jgi:hypothetical protein
VKDVCVGKGIDDECLLIESNSSAIEQCGKECVLDEDGKYRSECEKEE